MTSTSGHEHGGTTDTEWDFQPIYPSPAEELPAEFRESPANHEAFMNWVESQCGPTNDKQPVEQYDGTLGVTKSFVDRHESPVGQLQWNDDLDQRYAEPGRFTGERWCTGTLVDEDLFLTAGHCFDSIGGVPRRDGQRLRPHEIATNMHVNFNYQVDPSGNLRQEHEFDVVELVEHRIGGLDYALARLSGSPGSQFGTATVAGTAVQQGDTLCIIQHPEGLPKKVEAGTATHVHTQSTSGYLGRDYFGYGDIDTLRGSSGSGVLREPGGELVGVHTNGGCTGGRSGHNHGVKMSEILDASSVLSSPTVPPGSVKAIKDGTSDKAVDPEKLKFVDEPGGAKIPGDDDPLGGRGTMPYIDRRKAAGLDKQFDDTGGKAPAGDGLSPEYTPTRPDTDKALTPEKLKILDEPGGTTLPHVDDPFGGRGTMPYIDRRKATGLDKQFADTGVGTAPPGSGVSGSAGGAGGGGTRPFVLQTPHHSMAWTGEHGGEAGGGRDAGEAEHEELAASYERLLSRMQALLQRQQEQLRTLGEQYERLLGEYRSLAGEGSGP